MKGAGCPKNTKQVRQNQENPSGGTEKVGGQRSRKKEQEPSLAAHSEQLKTKHARRQKKQEREAATAGQGGSIASWQGEKRRRREQGRGGESTGAGERGGGGAEGGKADKSGKIKGTRAGGGGKWTQVSRNWILNSLCLCILPAVSDH